MHLAVDPLGHLLAVLVTPAAAQDRDPVEAVAAAGHEATGQTVALAVVDHGDTGAAPADDAATQGIRRAVVELPEVNPQYVRGVIISLFDDPLPHNRCCTSRCWSSWQREEHVNRHRAGGGSGSTQALPRLTERDDATP